MSLQLSQPRTFALHLRIPAWATGASVVGQWQAQLPRRSCREHSPAVLRDWRSGDRIELDLPLAQRLQAVDAEHPDTVALSAGPLVLMRLLDDGVAKARRCSADRAACRPNGSTMVSASGRSAMTCNHSELRAFADIDAQHYSAYQDVAG